MNKIFLFLFLMICLPAHAGDFGDQGLPQLTTIGTLDIWWGAPLQQISISCPEWQSDHSCSDDYILSVKVKDKTLTYPFTGTYGRYHLYLASLANYPNGDVVLLRSEGKGTSASSWNIDILEVGSDKIVLKFHKEIGNFFGSGEIWWYAVRFDQGQPDIDGNAHDIIRLALDHSPISHDPLEDVNDIPKERKVSIYWNSAKKQYVETAGWPNF